MTRTRITDRLNAALEASLILITAPAGWGKSSALAGWANQVDRTVVWVTCRPADNEPNRFLKSVVLAMGRAGIQVSGDLEAVLRSARPLPIKQVVSLLIEEFESFEEERILVLDDFHVMDSKDIQRAVYDFAIFGPENVAVVVSGRRTPEWSLARLRAHGQLAEFGTGDLAFDRGEIVALLGQGPGDFPVVEELEKRSEGWAAGIRLAQLWMQQGGDTSRLLDAFSGSHRDIADYLAEEVLGTLALEIEAFLLTTAVPDAISASLAMDITGEPQADATLAEVERQNLFLVPLDPERRWFRYHGVFREYLLTRLRRRQPGSEPDILRSVSRWYEQSGELVDAVDYALRAGDMQRACMLLEKDAEHLLLQRGEAHTLIRLTEQLPVDVLSRSFSLKQFYAWALVLVGRLDEAEALVEDANGVGGSRAAERAGIRARIAAYRGQDSETIIQAEAALEGNSEETNWFHADTLLSLGFAYRSIGRVDEAVEAFARAADTGWQCHFAHGALWGTRYQAITLVSQGRLQDAADLLDQGLDRAKAASLDRGAALAALLIGRGEVKYEQNNLRGAREDLERALTMAQSVGDAKILMNAYSALAMVEQAEEDHDRARDYARRAVRVFDGTGEKALQAWIALQHGDLGVVQRWQDGYISLMGAGPDLHAGEAEQTMLGRAMLETSEVSNATAFLESLREQAERSGRWGRAMAIRALLARAADRTGDESTAFSHVSEIIDLAMREGFVRSIVDEGPQLLKLLRRWARTEVSPGRRRYAARVLDAAAVGRGDVEPQAGQSLIESLTSRQMDVLRLMVDGLSNREIAEQLFVSEGTIKAHVHQVYGKLMVRNRAEAIRAARESGFV